MRVPLRLLSIVVMGALLMAGAVAFVKMKEQQEAAAPVLPMPRVTPKPPSWAANRAKYSVVKVLARYPNRDEEAFGTGFFVGVDGSIITNQHVVAGATDVSIQGEGDRSRTRASVRFADAALDLAVLEVTQARTPLRVRENDGLTIGEPLVMVSMGNRYWATTFTSEGKLQSYLPTTETGQQVIGCDIASYPGLSGSPVLSKNTGEVVGVLFAGSKTPGFKSVLIPASCVRRFMRSAGVRETGKMRTPSRQEILDGLNRGRRESERRRWGR